MASVGSSLLILRLILFPEECPDRLAGVRKGCKFLASELGMTRADLHPVLQAKLEVFQKGPDDVPEPLGKININELMI